MLFHFFKPPWNKYLERSPYFTSITVSKVQNKTIAYYTNNSEQIFILYFFYVFHTL